MSSMYFIQVCVEVQDDCHDDIEHAVVEALIMLPVVKSVVDIGIERLSL